MKEVAHGDLQFVVGYEVLVAVVAASVYSERVGVSPPRRETCFGVLVLAAALPWCFELLQEFHQEGWGGAAGVVAAVGVQVAEHLPSRLPLRDSLVVLDPVHQRPICLSILTTVVVALVVPGGTAPGAGLAPAIPSEGLALAPLALASFAPFAASFAHEDWCVWGARGGVG